MDWLNYHHLYYFWMVVRHNSVTKASRVLHLSQPTVSAQVRQLEEALKAKLLLRQRRGMMLTEVGRSVYRYADQIFALGRGLQEAVAGHQEQRPLRIAIGIADVVPKLVAQKLLMPLLTQTDPVQIICRENRPELGLGDIVGNVVTDCTATLGILAVINPIKVEGRRIKVCEDCAERIAGCRKKIV